MAESCKTGLTSILVLSNILALLTSRSLDPMQQHHVGSRGF